MIEKKIATPQEEPLRLAMTRGSYYFPIIYPKVRIKCFILAIIRENTAESGISI
jgi:hypothetical protein